MVDATLHTKYRPRTWENVLGQRVVKQSLIAALKKGTSHAFLFCGPSGTGKTTLARIAAREAGCSDQAVLEIDAASFTGIDDMRGITSSLSYRPFEGDIRAIVVDECHRLTGAAWASLLKAVEEPPAWVYWFLCTTELGKVPPTIVTRCTKYELQPVATDDIFDLLGHVADKEKLGLSDGIIELCAKRAQGSPRQGLVNLGACAGAKDAEAARVLLKAVEGSAGVKDLCQALLDRRGWSAIQPILTDMKDQNGESVRQVVRDYMTKVVLGAKSDKAAVSALAVLDEFSQPFPPGDGISPVVLACGRLLLQ